MTRIVVVGSLNLDLVIPVKRQPRPGETLIGGDRSETEGGKGGNQAVAAARLGASVCFVGRVGADDEGQRLRATLEHEGIDVSHLVTDEDAPSGMALITVAEDGENVIVVSPGANDRVDITDVEDARGLIEAADVLVCQHEVPPEAVEAAIRVASAAGVRTILNPAPARAVPSATLAQVDVLVPNQSELGALCGVDAPTSTEAAGDLAESLVGPKAVVVTLGSEGALVVTAGQRTLVSSSAVAVIDTTGAGDTFCGALAVALGEGLELSEAARFAARAAALSVGAAGARGGMPGRDELED